MKSKGKQYKCYKITNLIIIFLLFMYIQLNDVHTNFIQGISKNYYFSISSELTGVLIFCLAINYILINIFKKENKLLEVLFHIVNIVLFFLWSMVAQSEWSYMNLSKEQLADVVLPQTNYIPSDKMLLLIINLTILYVIIETLCIFSYITTKKRSKNIK